MSQTVQTAPVRWHPDRADKSMEWARPGLMLALLRGAAGRCPCCGQGALFCGWLRQVPSCARCAAPLGQARADDAPPYAVIFIVAHAVIAAQVLTDAWLDLSLAAEAAIFLPLTLALCLGLLRPIKGAVIGLIMQLGLAGDEAVQPR